MSIHAELTAPLLVQSSKTLGWSDDLEMRVYLEPDTIEGWVEPVIPQISVLLLSHGAMQMEYQHKNGWKQQRIQQDDAFLKSAGTRTLETRWNRLSVEPMRTRHLLLNMTVFERCAEEIADSDPSRISLVGRVGFQDALLIQMGHTLQHEMDHPSPVGKLYAESAAYLLAVHLLRHYSAERVKLPVYTHGLKAKQLQGVKDYVQSHLAEDLSLGALASVVGFSPYHFARLFRQSTGESVHQFVLRQRLEQAQYLLRKSDLPIAQIALCCGFAHQSHLTRAFRRHFHMTPHIYRQHYT